MTLVLDGKRIAAEIRGEVAQGVTRLRERGVAPCLCVVLVGEDPASQVYVRNKDKAATDAGFQVRTLRLPASIAQADLEHELRRLSQDGSVHGILLQLPLPRPLLAQPVLAALDPAKDVDGLTSANVAALWLERHGLFPCTPLGCIEILARSGLTLEGKHLVILGRSNLVGKPLLALGLQRNATVSICHSRTLALADHCARADVLVAAIGRAELVRGEWLKPEAIVLDVGINRLSDGRLVGDVHYPSAVERVAAITPVPGGIGPMTIAMLLGNTLRAATRLSGLAELETSSLSQAPRH